MKREINQQMNWRKKTSLIYFKGICADANPIPYKLYSIYHIKNYVSD